MAHNLRKPPNAFNFMRQIQILQRAGSTSGVERSFEARTKPTKHSLPACQHEPNIVTNNVQ